MLPDTESAGRFGAAETERPLTIDPRRIPRLWRCGSGWAGLGWPGLGWPQREMDRIQTRQAAQAQGVLIHRMQMTLIERRRALQMPDYLA